MEMKELTVRQVRDALTEMQDFSGEDGLIEEDEEIGSELWHSVFEFILLTGYNIENYTKEEALTLVKMLSQIDGKLPGEQIEYETSSEEKHEDNREEKSKDPYERLSEAPGQEEIAYYKERSSYTKGKIVLWILHVVAIVTFPWALIVTIYVHRSMYNSLKRTEERYLHEIGATVDVDAIRKEVHEMIERGNRSN